MTAPLLDEIDRLGAALKNHHAGGAADGDAGNLTPPFVSVACHVLLRARIAPEETLWPRDEASALREPLCSPAAERSPEAQVVRMWLTICLGEANSATGDCLERLVAESLYAPFRGLAFRALAYLGRRRALAGAGVMRSLEDYDAWLEAALPAGCLIGRTEYLDDGGASTSDVTSSWRQLLEAEIAIDAADAPQVRLALSSLTRASDTEPTPFAQAVRRRVAARAAAALIRANLTWTAKDIVPVTSLGALPLWEREYLEGLQAWQRRDVALATDKFRASIAANPWQGSVRLALAAVRAPTAPDEALAELGVAAPTRQVLTARTALLVRLRRFPEAEAVLHEAADALDEPIRFAGARWKRRCRRQELSLQAAFAERRGDWQTAARYHLESAKLHETSGSKQPQWLADARASHCLRARRLFLEAKRARSFQGPVWLKEQYRSLVEQGDQDLAGVPLTGDARLFRALAIIDTSPDRAAVQLNELLAEPGWTTREGAVGGDRILVAADALASLGRVSEALSAYESMPMPWPRAVEERRAVALVYEELARGKSAADLSRAARAVGRVAPRNCWPHVFAALAHALAGQAPQANAHLAEARQFGAADAIAGYVQSVLLVREGRAIEGDALVNLELPDASWRILSAFCDGAAGRDEAKALLASLDPDWIARFVVQPDGAAAQLLIEWARTGKLAEAWPVVERLAEPNGPLSRDLVAWLTTMQALDLATRRRWQEAEAHLARAEALVS